MGESRENTAGNASVVALSLPALPYRIGAWQLPAFDPEGPGPDPRRATSMDASTLLDGRRFS